MRRKQSVSVLKIYLLEAGVAVAVFRDTVHKYMSVKVQLMTDNFNTKYVLSLFMLTLIPVNKTKPNSSRQLKCMNCHENVTLSNICR